MNVLVALAILLLIFMLLIGGKKGGKSFISLLLNFAVFILLLFFTMDPNINPVFVTFIASIAMVMINLFFVNEVNLKTKIAFGSTMITLCLLVFLMKWIVHISLVQGFAAEEIVELAPFSLKIGIDFTQLFVMIVMISTVGAITDVAIAISSPMKEIVEHHPNIERKELFQSGIRIGRDILGTDTNTLVFAFIGSYLALFLLFKDLSYSIGEMLNSKIFIGEVITILCASIGIAVIIPITALINAYFLTKKAS